jgi:hypothetical protein
VLIALGYQLPAAFGAASGEYLTAVLRGHTRAEPMRALTTHFTRLIGTLHTAGSRDDTGRSKKGGKAKPLTAKASIDFLFFGLQHTRRSV